MKDEWQKLIEELKRQGLTPKEIRRIITVYKIAKKVDKELEEEFDESN
ncbi:hypothetical protein [Bacillus methanolicus]|uniref:Sin domain-containing protein n=1 Tax=Bacillus methanolicus (strain MGA3 / ATCC 53907) TaxID=796606 RepID=I3E7U9_BACMM|nr:hypothetical protein [Bacillus methanolicus]AIE59388.1 hypothetical protein BMMGA3_04780 [Bacillus methanolicus MGA3]EIJ82570.1 hypothetical protein MGA3_05015 [Bacillus methanolicus MGA3]